VYKTYQFGIWLAAVLHTYSLNCRLPLTRLQRGDSRRGIGNNWPERVKLPVMSVRRYVETRNIRVKNIYWGFLDDQSIGAEGPAHKAAMPLADIEMLKERVHPRLRADAKGSVLGVCSQLQ
jgi:hypothetical protein